MAADHEGVSDDPVAVPNSALPNTLRCEKCGGIFLLDLFGEGFTAEEVEAKRASHERIAHS